MKDKNGADRYTTEIIVSGFNSVVQMLDLSNNSTSPVEKPVIPIEPVSAESWPDDVPFNRINQL